jgi:DNA-directed RNA polymerase specialized sigma24 family protein
MILLIAGAGLTYDETAEALGIAVGTVRSRYSRWTGASWTSANKR